ncbi:hypothetical protein C8Q77DRAFT_1115416 [Trametes polyzona]|nr:hypothetical protein C8Q77DRAFT_1115416 [Trametes polyzona]
MAESIRAPWILDYLISVAEQFGGDLSAVPRTDKPHKAQLVKFLTFAPPDTTEPCVIWADVSDKKHFMHARLSVDAIQRFSRDPNHAGVSLTSYKSALVRLTKIRPAFGRVARRGHGGGMTEQPCLYLDVDNFDLLGSFGEPIWGAPVDIVQDAIIREWMFGLQQDGGGGNVLKLRKERMLAQAAEKANQLQTSASDALHQVTIDTMDVKVRVARKSAVYKPRPSTDAGEQRPVASKEAIRRASWKRLYTNMSKYLRPPDDVFEQLLRLYASPGDPRPVSVREQAVSPKRQGISHSRAASREECNSPGRRKRSASPRTPRPHADNCPSPARTPSTWTPSVRASPLSRHGGADDSSDTEEEPGDVFDETNDVAMARDGSTHTQTSSPEVPMDVDVDEPVAAEREPTPSRSSSMPPPAQPRNQPPPSSMFSVPYATSPRRSSPAPRPSTQNTSRDMDALPPSSFPASSYRPPPSPTSSPRPVPATPANVAPLLRRVPVPRLHPLRRDPDASGEGRVLVENSDTASPGSQRPSQSQSQSQGQSQGGDVSQSSGGHPSSQLDPHSQSQSQSQSHSQSQSQSQPVPSQLRNEIGNTAEPNADGTHTSVLEAKEDASKEQREKVGESEGSTDQQQGRSQQSLSYMGDSQSQEDPAQAASADKAEPAQDAMPIKGVSATVTPAVQPRELQQPIAATTANEPEPSPMDVDHSAGTNDAPVASAPGWAVYAAEAKRESLGESSTEVDELLSDPLAAAPQDVWPPRRSRAANRPGPTKAPGKAAAGKGRGDGEQALDSDDARTAAIVEPYAAKAQKIIEARRAHALQGDTRPSAPTEKPSAQGAQQEGDVKRDDLVSEEAATSAPSKAPAHDPSIWAAPAFMRRTRGEENAPPAKVSAQVQEKRAPSVKPAEVTQVAQGRKRERRPSSPSAEQGESPTKKRKTSTAAVPVRPPPPDRPVASSSKTWTAKRDSAQPPSRPQMRASSSARTVPSSTSVGGSAKTQNADLHAAARSSSHASSSRTSRVPEKDVSHVAPRTSSTSLTMQPLSSKAGSSTAKAKSVHMSSSRERRSGGASTVPALSRKTSSASSVHATRQTPPPPHVNTVVSSSQSGGKVSSTSSQDLARQELLSHGAFSRSLELERTTGGPPLLSWAELMDILLQTGVARAQRQHGHSQGVKGKRREDRA